MRLKEAEDKLAPYIGVRFGDIFPPEYLRDLRTNKGNVGQLLERAIGLANSSRNLDFDDGELKTNKCDDKGNPLETIFITQISSCIDDILSKRTFEETHLYEKIRNILYVPISKVGDEAQWRILLAKNIDISLPQYADLQTQFREDYYTIADQLLYHINHSPDGFIHTSNGHFIQIRSKDSKPYRPIYSKIFGRNVSNKNHAFYFKKDFAKHILSVL